MPRIIRHTLISVRDLAVTLAPFVLLVLVLLIGAYFLLDPQPPKHVVLLTGPEQSAYAEFGKRYATELRRYGIDVVLKPTMGSANNRRLLRGIARPVPAADAPKEVPLGGAAKPAPAADAAKQVPLGDAPKEAPRPEANPPVALTDAKETVDLGFVQGGSSDAARAADEDKSGVALVSLGSLFYEPLWLFYRVDSAKKLPGAALTQLAQLRGWRVNVGARGSGTPGLLGKLLLANGVEREDLRRSNLELTPAVVALLGGELDAMAFAAPPESPMVQMLMQSPDVKLFEFTQAEAYARRFPYLTPLLLPRGVIDLARNVPPRDTQVLASTTALVARAGTHPALLQLFVQAARNIHGGAGWLTHAGQFPSPQNTEQPLAAEAERYYRTGVPLLQRYLPFWLANLIDRMWVVLVSIVAVLIPLSRWLPPLYNFRIRSRIFRWYRQLRQIEDALGKDNAVHAQLLDDLNKLDAKVERVSVPLSYTDQLYSLRSHIQLVRERLRHTT